MRAWTCCLLLVAGCPTKVDPGLFGPTDDDTDVVVESEAPRDTGVDTFVPVDDTDATCRLLAVVTNHGPALVDFGVELVLADRLDGAADDLSDVVVKDEGGAELPHWVQHADAGTGTIWVKVDLSHGDTTLVVDACGDGDDAGRALDVFPLYATFTDAGAVSGTCSALDVDETCSVTGEDVDGEPVLAIATHSSCFFDPYDGAWGELAADVTLPPGQWRLDFRTWVTGQHYEYCSGGTSISVAGSVDGTVVGSHGCGLSACAACDEGWVDVTSTPVAGDGGTHRVAIRGGSGDCADLTSWVDDVWLHQVADPDPRVRFEQP